MTATYLIDRSQSIDRYAVNKTGNKWMFWQTIIKNISRIINKVTVLTCFGAVHRPVFLEHCTLERSWRWLELRHSRAMWPCFPHRKHVTFGRGHSFFLIAAAYNCWEVDTWSSSAFCRVTSSVIKPTSWSMSACVLLRSYVQVHRGL